MGKRTNQFTVADAFLELLASRGVKYFFGNSGTDFAPIIEAFAKRQRPRGQHSTHLVEEVFRHSLISPFTGQDLLEPGS